MKKNLLKLSFLALFFMAACKGRNHDKPEDVARKWCELTEKMRAADSYEERTAAKAARKAYEKEVEREHSDDKEFMRAIEAAIDCDD